LYNERHIAGKSHFVDYSPWTVNLVFPSMPRDGARS